MNYFVVGSFLLLFSLSSVAISQVHSLADELEWRQRDKELELELKNRALEENKSIQLPDVDVLPDVSKDETCFVLHSIEINGRFSKWATRQGKVYIDECVTITDIQTYIRKINQYILSKGFVTTKAILPEQNISAGYLKVEILEGLVDEIQFPDHYESYWQYALPLRHGDILNIRDMEQGVDQLSRLQSQKVEFDIVPAGQAGMSNLVANIKQSKPWYINASISNGGSQTTGLYPLSLSGGIDNIYGLQDSLTFSLSKARALSFGESNGSSLTWSVPIRFTTFEMATSYSDYRQSAEGSVTNFELTGSSHDNSVSIDYVLLRNNKTKITLSTGLETRERRSYIDGTEIEVQSRNLSEFQIGAAYQRYIGSAVLNMSVDLHQGIEAFESDEVDSDAESGIAQPIYRFYSVAGSINRPFSIFKKNITYSATFAGQHAATPIYSLDWFSIGGQYTVRGFASDESLSSDAGWRLKNDFTVPVRIKNISTSSYWGIDVGQVFGSGVEGVSENTLMGAGVGLRGSAFSMNYDVLYSRPLLIYGPDADKRSQQFNASLSIKF